MSKYTEDDLREELKTKEYEYGFYTDIESETFSKGLNEDIVKAISTNADKMQRDTANSDIFTRGQLHIVTSQYNPAFIVEFKQLFPVSLTGMQFDATINDVEYITAEVTFKHQEFYIRDQNMQPL